MKLSKKVKLILSLLELTESEIVSYGIAPNPMGFCYERGEKMSKKNGKILNDLLESLNEKETNELRELVFN